MGLGVELTPANAGILKPMHLWAYFVEVTEKQKGMLRLPKGKEELVWMPCEEATLDFLDAQGNLKWRYIQSSAVLKSGLCQDPKRPQKAIIVVLSVACAIVIYNFRRKRHLAKRERALARASIESERSVELPERR